MKLVYPHDLPRLGVEQVYRHSRLVPVIVFLATAGFSAGWAVYVYLNEGSPILYFPSLGVGIVAAFTLTATRAAFRSSNWLMKVTPDGVYIKFRSYLNHHYPDDTPTVVYLAASEIEGVRKMSEDMRLPNRDGGDMTATLHFLEFRLAVSCSERLGEALEAERRKPPGGGRIETKHHDYPVRLIPPNRMLILWRARPGLDHALRLLGGRFGRDEDLFEIRTPWHAMTPEQQEALILELCERGETVAAVRLTRMRYDMKITEAKQFVDGILYGAGDA